MYQEILNAIGTIGFPIVAFLLMYKMSCETIKENTTALNEINTALAKLLEKEDIEE